MNKNIFLGSPILFSPGTGVNHDRIVLSRLAHADVSKKFEDRGVMWIKLSTLKNTPVLLEEAKKFISSGQYSYIYAVHYSGQMISTVSKYKTPPTTFNSDNVVYAIVGANLNFQTVVGATFAEYNKVIEKELTTPCQLIKLMDFMAVYFDSVVFRLKFEKFKNQTKEDYDLFLIRHVPEKMDRIMSAHLKSFDTAFIANPRSSGAFYVKCSKSVKVRRMTTGYYIIAVPKYMSASLQLSEAENLAEAIPAPIPQSPVKQPQLRRQMFGRKMYEYSWTHDELLRQLCDIVGENADQYELIVNSSTPGGDGARLMAKAKFI